MEHPEIKSKLSVTANIRGAQVTLTNGFSTERMTLNELVYAAQKMLKAADEIKQLVRDLHSIRGANHV